MADLGEREGQVVSVLTNRSMILEAFRRGWIDSVELADKLLLDAMADVGSARESIADPAEFAKLSLALAKVAQGAANMRTKAISTAEQPDKVAHGDTHNHLHLHGSDPSKMTDDELSDYINELRLRLAGPGVSGSGTSEA